MAIGPETEHLIDKNMGIYITYNICLQFHGYSIRMGGFISLGFFTFYLNFSFASTTCVTSFPQEVILLV